MAQQQMMQAQLDPMMNEKYFNIKFTKVSGETNKINIKGSKRIKDLLDKYIDEVYGPFTSKKLGFIYNGGTIDRNDQRKVEDFFKNKVSYTILVIENNDYI